MYRRVPWDWKFPKLGLQPMYAYWHCGNENDNIPPIKWLQCSDVDRVGKRARATLAKMRRVMTLIDDRARAKGLRVKANMNHVEANTLYAHGEEVIKELVSGKTLQGRERNVSALKLSSVVTFIQRKS